MNYALFEDFLRGSCRAVAVAGHNDVHTLEWSLAHNTQAVDILNANHLAVYINSVDGSNNLTAYRIEVYWKENSSS